MPRVVLDGAKAHGDAEAIGAFLSRFPGSRFDVEARAALASTCTTVGDGYAKGSSRDLFDDLDLFARQHPVCAAERDSVSARSFDARRKALREDADLEPALRDTFIALVDRAERTRAIVPFDVVVRAGTIGGPEQYYLANGLRVLVGAVIDPRIDPTETNERESLEIWLRPLACPMGQSPNVGALALSFDLRVDGSSRARWSRRAKDGSEIFAALATRGEPALDELCSQPTLRP